MGDTNHGHVNHNGLEFVTRSDLRLASKIIDSEFMCRIPTSLTTVFGGGPPKM